MSSEIKEKLAQLNIEDFIWIIYFLIILMSYYSNHLERKYLINSSLVYKEKYRKVMVIIFSILIVVYVYFLQDSFKSLVSLKPSDSSKKKKLVYLSFLASLFIAISGFIFLYISIVDENLDVELAFN